MPNPTKVTLFCGLLLAHLLYDFHWQGEFIGRNKGKHPFLLAVHALTWALFLTAVMWWFGQASLLRLVFLFATHFLTDRWKSRLPKTNAYFWAIYVDQGLHLIQIVAVMWL